jgi:hypothetical protein
MQNSCCAPAKRYTQVLQGVATITDRLVQGCTIIAAAGLLSADLITLLMVGTPLVNFPSMPKELRDTTLL